MRRSARMLRAGQDVREYHLDAELLHAFREGGSAIPCLWLHRRKLAPMRACCTTRRCRAGARWELVLIDAGCELDGYASDITCTFRPMAKFTARSARCTTWCWPARTPPSQPPKAGARFNDPHDATVAVLAQACSTWGCWTRTRWAPPGRDRKRAYFQFTCTAPATGWAWMCTTAAATWSPVRWAGPANLGPALGRTITNRPSRVLPRHGADHRAWAVRAPAEACRSSSGTLASASRDDAVVTEAVCRLITRDVPVDGDAIEALDARLRPVPIPECVRVFW